MENKLRVNLFFVIAWLLFTLIMLDIGFTLLSEASTIANIIGLILVICWIGVTIWTIIKSYKINKK